MIPVSGGVAARPVNRNLKLALIVVGLLVLFYGVNGILHRPSPYEKIAAEMTIALQNNDLAGVEKFQNAETATQVNHAIVGRDADAFAPLGKLKSVHETAADAQTRVHDFDANFDKGVVHEKIRFDPDNKVVGFKYELPAPK